MRQAKPISSAPNDSDAASSGLRAERDRRIRRLLDEFVDDLSRGGLVSDAEFASRHPDLMPELAEELRGLREIWRDIAIAGRVGLVKGPIAPLTASQLDASIDADHSSDPGAAGSPAVAASGDDVERGILRVPGYVILGQIDRGGQAPVYRATQDVTGSTVAIKVLPGGAFAHAARRARFEQEAQILVALSHSNIVSIIDRGRTLDGSFFFVMPFIDGRTLDDYIEDSLGQSGPDALDLPRLLQLFVQIAGAVEAAHDGGIVHRDLKPSNVMVDRHGQPHVLDFGLARLLDESAPGGADAAESAGRHGPVTLTGQVLGSLQWTSPEQASGNSKAADERSDVYSLGVMLYHALTGAFPYDVEGPLRHVMDNIVDAAPRPMEQAMRRRWGECPSALADIVSRALAKSPEQRYASAAEFLAELQRFLSGRSTIASALASRRRRRRLTVFTVVALALGGGAAAAWRGYAGRIHREGGPPFATTVEPSPLRRAALAYTGEPGRLFTNAAGIEFVRIEAGRFMRGSPGNETGRYSDEGLHEVVLSRPFFLGRTEVTQGQYRRVMGANPSEFVALGDDLPVNNVSHADALEFCRRLGEIDARRYRLPTEAQWEYACRAGTMSAFAGDGNLDSMGWYIAHPGQRIHPVGQKEPNHWGVFDMHGNVREWCRDWKASYPRSPEPLVDPEGPTSRVHRVVRGGDVTSNAARCRSASRHVVAPDVALSTLGFRVLLEIDDAAAAAAGPR